MPALVTPPPASSLYPRPRRVIVCGSRSSENAAFVASVLDRVHNASPIGVLVTGGATGVDAHAAAWGEARYKSEARPQLEVHPADWDTHGKSAGPIRNQEMAALGADLCVAFAGGPGTADMRARATKRGIAVLDVTEWLNLQARLDSFEPAIAKMNASAATPAQRASWQAKRYEQQQRYQRDMDKLTALFGAWAPAAPPPTEASAAPATESDGQRLTVRLVLDVGEG